MSPSGLALPKCLCSLPKLQSCASLSPWKLVLRIYRISKHVADYRSVFDPFPSLTLDEYWCECQFFNTLISCWIRAFMRLAIGDSPKCGCELDLQRRSCEKRLKRKQEMNEPGNNEPARNWLWITRWCRLSLEARESVNCLLVCLSVQLNQFPSVNVTPIGNYSYFIKISQYLAKIWPKMLNPSFYHALFNEDVEINVEIIDTLEMA